MTRVLWLLLVATVVKAATYGNQSTSIGTDNNGSVDCGSYSGSLPASNLAASTVGTTCNIQVSAIQLFYWPTPAPLPNITTIVGPDGFTYTSPSAYVVLQGISATGPCGIIGPTYASYTTSYAESDISTFRLNQPGLPHTIDYADFFSNCTTRAANYTYPRPSCEIELGDSIVNQYPSCVSQINLLSQSMNYDQIHCYPYFSYPSGLQAINTAWATCVDSSDGGYFAEIFDPPRALTSASDLVPAPTKDPGNAIPAASPSQPLPSKTISPPTVSPPASGSKNGPSAQDPNDPEDPGSSKGTPIADPHPNPDPADGDTRLPNSQKTAAPPISASASSGSGEPVNGLAPPVDSTQDPDPGNSKSQINGDVNPGNGAGSIDTANDPANNPTHDPANNPANDPASNPADPPTQPSQVFTTVQGHAIQAASPFDTILVDGKSVARNQDSTLIQGTPVALLPNGDLILGTSTVSNLFPAQSPTPTSIFTIGGQTFTLSSNKLLGAGTTLNANDPGFIIDGTVVSLGSSGLRIGSSIVTPVTPAAVITAAGQPFTILSNGIAVAGTILTSNAQAITIAGTRISLGPQGLVVGTSTLPLPVPTPAQVITVNGQAATLLPNGIIIAGTTLNLNAPGITVSGTPISLGAQGLVVGTSKLAVPTPTPVQSQVMTVAGQPATLFSNGIIIAGTTLTPNGPEITISGTPISVGPLGVVAGTLTIPLTSANPTITVAGQRATILPDGVIIAGTTLTANAPAITIAGTVVSLGPSGLVVGTSTIPLGGGTSPTQNAVGGFIIAGLNGGPATPSKEGSTGTSFNGTGTAGGVLIFSGDGNRVAGRWGAVVATVMLLLSGWFQCRSAHYRI